MLSTGSFAPLRFLPKGKVVMPGSSAPRCQSWRRSTLKRRIDEAAKILPLDQLAISLQCGFASDLVGNLLSEDEQKRKLERVVEGGAAGAGQVGACFSRRSGSNKS